MATKKKMLQAAAGNAGETFLDITDVFSTYLYKGNNNGSGSGPNPTRAITNGLNLKDEGGLIWLKVRDTNPYNNGHILLDSSNDYDTALFTNNNDAASNAGQFIIDSVEEDGFTLGYYGWTNYTDDLMTSWSFRKAPKFFDVQTYTGTGSAQTINHNLGSKPGFYVVKQTSGTGGGWYGYHAGLDSTYTNPSGIRLDTTSAAFEANSTLWNLTFPTSTTFTVGTSTGTNASGATYVAYLFAHNDGDGEFGPDSDQDIIKCGSFSLNGSYEADVNLGFEPQWLMIKPAEDAASWTIFDTMRGATVNGDAAWLSPNLDQAEANTSNRFWPTATGFHIGNYGITAGNDIIYMAIRRGPLAPPESATEVFAVAPRTNTTPAFTSGFPVDFLIGPRTINGADNNEVKTRLISGGYLRTSTTGAETASSQSANFAHNDGFFNYPAANANQYSWMWKRAPSFFDSVAFFGSGVAGRTVSHNLGVAPEMMWVKERDNTTNWNVYHTGLNGGTTPQDYFIRLNLDNAEIDNNTLWNDTAPTDTQFTVGLASDINGSNDTYIAYLFATLAGISKVGSYTGTGSQRVINCGFSSGARFVLIKRTDTAGYHWYFWDSMRGIVAGADPFLRLNVSNAQVGTDDILDPDSSGFSLANGNSKVNASGGNYIFYAIA